MTVSLNLGPEPKPAGALWQWVVVLVALVAMVGCQGLTTGASSPPTQQGALALSSLALDFGSVVVGSSNTLTITATNGGTSAVTVSSVVSTGTAFSISGPALPATVAVGQRSTWKITFTPSATGSATASLSIASDASNSSVSAALTGTGLAPGQLAAPTSVGFGAVTLGKSQSKSVTLSNAGGSSLTVSQATINGSGFQLSGLTPPMTLGPGQTASFGVVFDPLVSGTVNGSISLTTSASMSAPAVQQRRAKTVSSHLLSSADDTGSTIVTIAVSGQGVTPAQLALSPTTVGFTNVQDGTSQNQFVSLTNTGGSTANVSQATVTGTGFSIGGLTLPLALAAGQSATFKISFAPISAGAANGDLNLVSDAANPSLDLPLSGTGVTPGALASNPTSINFGGVVVGLSQKITATLTNSGGESVTVSQATATGSGFSLSGLTLPLTLTAGQSTSFDVSLNPSATGSVSGNLAVTSDASNPTLNVPLTGNGLAAGSLSANPSSLSFGNVQDGNPQTLSEMLTNTGGSSVNITQAAVTGAGLTITGLNLPLTLTAGQSSPSFSVIFTPQSAGAVNGSLLITSTASNPTLTVPLSATGVTAGSLTATTTPLSFGSVQTGKSKSLAETLTNAGGSSVRITQADVTGTGFSLTDLSLPLTLGPGQSSPSFNVLFAPQAAGAVSGNIAVTSDASNPTFNVPLTATGVTPGLMSASPTSLSFGNVQTGNNKTLTETLTNSGGSKVTISQATVTGAGLSMNGLTLPLNLDAGQSSPSFNVVFAPQAASTVSGNLAITSNASNPTLNVSIAATGVTPGTLTANPTSLSFGSVQTSSNKTLTETLTNSGGASLTITQATASGAGLSINGLTLPLTLSAGQSSPSFNVVFAPPATGAVNGNLAITSNASNPTLNITLSGTGIAPATLSPTQSSLSFGSVQVGNNKTLSETVTNTGGASATISQDAATGTGLSVSGLNPPVTLTSGQSVTFNVIFTPQSAVTVNGNLAITSNASNPSLNIPLSGTGTAVGQLTASTALAFGNVVVGTSANLPASLSATGASVTVTSVNMSSSEFTLSGISFPTTITAGNSLPFTVTFTPQATGAASGTASFVSNAANSPTVLSFGGNGTPAPVHSVALNWTASSSSNISGYNMYRGTSSSGPFNQINPSLISGTAYTDNSVVDGTTYYYEATAVDSSNQESAKSTPAAQAIIPAP